MLVYTNTIGDNSYIPYLKNLSNLQSAAKRLATGEKYAAATDGSGELGVAELMSLQIKGTNSLIASMENAEGYANTQDEILGHVADIIQRMTELASAAVDPTKTTADRVALNQEYTLLDQEIEDIAENSKYNGTRLFDTTTTVRIGMDSSDTITFSRVRLSHLSFTAMSITNTTHAQSTLSTLDVRMGSLSVLRSIARSHASRVERMLAITQSYSSNLAAGESAIRHIDLAKETGEFTRQQVVLSASQAVLTQANRLHQTAAQFFQF